MDERFQKMPTFRCGVLNFAYIYSLKMNYLQHISITLRQQSKTVVHIGYTNLKLDLK